MQKKRGKQNGLKGLKCNTSGSDYFIPYSMQLMDNVGLRQPILGEWQWRT